VTVDRGSRGVAAETPGLRALFTAGYEGADAANATRLTAVICSLSAVLAAAFLALRARRPGAPRAKGGASSPDL
jgi:hypothetical protein